MSDGAQLVTMPTTIIGEDCATATAQLLRVKVSASCPSTLAIPSSTVAAGHVIRVRYGKYVNPVHVPVGATVKLILSRGSGTSTTTTTTTVTATTTTTVATGVSEPMPHVVGDTYAQAYAAMKAAKLYFSTQGPNSGGDKWTTVTGSSPTAGTPVKQFSNVILVREVTSGCELCEAAVLTTRYYDDDDVLDRRLRGLPRADGGVARARRGAARGRARPPHWSVSRPSPTPSSARATGRSTTTCATSPTTTTRTRVRPSSGAGASRSAASLQSRHEQV